ncbi:MAG: DUF6033 family protein [Lachnospiraceae bacterium]
MGLSISSGYHAYQSYAKKADSAVEQQTKLDLERKTTNKTSQVKLSEKAQKVLERIKEKYSDMDIMVADFQGDDEAKEILSRGTKEFSVLFSSDELEKMAKSEDYEKECMDRIDGAVQMSKRIAETYGQEAALEKDGDSTIVSRIGISFNGDGTTSIFAQLEQLTAKQKEHIKAERAKRAEERAESEETEKTDKTGKTAGNVKQKKLQKEKDAKRTEIIVDTEEELIERLQSMDWNKIKENDQEKVEGSKIDFSI